jgi:hypothetical protein
MIADTTESTIVLETKTFDDRAWKREASKTLQVASGMTKADADAHAETLFEIYVTEKGFDTTNYRHDPNAAVLDAEEYVPEPRRKAPRIA